MTNTITAERRELAAALGDLDLTVYDHVPENVDAADGAVIIAAGTGYVVRDATFAPTDYRLTLSAWVVVDPKLDNAGASEALDDALQRVLLAIPPAWAVAATDEPDLFTTGEWTAYGLRLTLTALITLETDTDTEE